VNSEAQSILQKLRQFMFISTGKKLMHTVFTSRSWLFSVKSVCACSQTAISELPIKILPSPLHSAIPLS